MADIIEEIFYINISHIMQTAFLYHCVTLCQRVLCTPVGAETVAPLMEFRVFDSSWTLMENHGCLWRLPEAKNDRKSSISRPAGGAWHSGSKG